MGSLPWELSPGKALWSGAQDGGLLRLRAASSWEGMLGGIHEEERCPVEWGVPWESGCSESSQWIHPRNASWAPAV